MLHRYLTFWLKRQRWGSTADSLFVDKKVYLRMRLWILGCHSFLSSSLEENLYSNERAATDQHSMVDNRLGTPDNTDKNVPNERIILPTILCSTAEIITTLLLFLFSLFSFSILKGHPNWDSELAHGAYTQWHCFPEKKLKWWRNTEVQETARFSRSIFLHFLHISALVLWDSLWFPGVCMLLHLTVN